jgi:AraC-like DNA-binding protein
MFDAIVIFGMFVPVILLRHAKDHTRSNVYLGAFFLTMSIYPLYRSVLVNFASESILALFLPVLMPIFMLSGPMLYLYVRNNLSENTIRLAWWQYTLHFLPAILSIVNMLPYSFVSMAEKEQLIRGLIENPNNIYQIPFFFFPNSFLFLIRPITGIVYILICFWNIYQVKKTSKENSRELLGVNFKWLYLILSITLLNFTSLVIMIFDFVFFHTTLDSNVMTIVVVTFPMLCVAALNVSILFFPSVFYGVFKTTKNSEEETAVVLNDEAIGMEEIIDEDARKSFKMVADTLEIYFQSKPYLQPGFNLSTITSQTDLPYHKITSYFSVYLGINFNDWKNNARVDYAVDLINSGRAKNLTLESIATSCGFLSRSNFVNAFKKKMNMTPSEYMRSLPNQDLVVNLNF